jgi:DNA-binding NarL/FixJ family response regulator
MRVTIADDHRPFAEGLAAWLAELGIEVLRIACDADELLAFVAEDPPDVVIVDICMPPTRTDEGLQAAEALDASHPDVGVLVISTYSETGWATRLLRRRQRGVGYLLKNSVDNVAVLRDALDRVRAGGVVIDPEIAANLVTQRTVALQLESLTKREREVLRVLAEGRSNAGIARVLGIAARTVENHVSNIFAKLNVVNVNDGNPRVLAVLELQRAEGRSPHRQ